MKSLPHPLTLSLAAAGLLFTTLSARSADLYWNPQGGSTIWNTTLENWSPTSGGTAYQAWQSGAENGDIAFFEGTGSPLTLSESFSAGGLRFTGNGYQLSASTLQALTLTGTAPALEVDAGATATLGSNLLIASTSKAFSKTGGGTLELTGTGFAQPSFYLGGISSGTAGARINLEAGILSVSSSALNNSYTQISIAAGSELQVNNTLNIGALIGSGAITNSGATRRYIQIRGFDGDFSGTISGAISLTSNNGTESQRFSGNQSNTFTGNVIVDVGTFILAKTDGAIAVSGAEVILGGGTLNTTPNSLGALVLAGENQISNTTDLIFADSNYRTATFDLDGHSANLDTLTINHQGSANANGRYVIDFGDNELAQTLSFSGLIVNGSGIVEVLNLGNNDQLLFTTDPTAYLGSFLLDGGQAYAFDMGDHWRVAAIPEPGTVALAVGGLLAISGWRWRKR